MAGLQADEGPIARTSSGSVRGFEEAGVNVFLGVPYAEPPVGRLRYQLARPPVPWSGTRPCLEPGANCPQGTTREVADERYPLPQPQDEDCLYLNVWTPALDDARRPVIVYVHSGGYFLGTGYSDYLDGGAFARDDVVFVSCNYRLNGLGFLYLDELFEKLSGTGNLGISDVARVLEWVQENIVAFGGDPDRVTVAGHSAGGITAVHLMTASIAPGLFHRALPVSCVAGNGTRMPDGATRVARRVLQEIDVRPGDLDSLLALPARRLVIPNTIVGELHEIAGKHPLGPVVDGGLLTGPALAALRAGAGRGIDLMIGTTTEEFRLIVFGYDGEVLAEPLRMGVSAKGHDYLKLFKGDHVDPARIVDVYSRSLVAAGRPPEAPDIFAAAAGDLVMLVPSADTAEAQSRHSAHSYLYRFGWRPPAGGGRVGAQHGTDIPFFFNRPRTREWAFLFCDSAPQDLATQYHDSVVAFARSGDPSHPGLPPWPTYEQVRRATMIFGDETIVVDDPDRERRQLFDDVEAYAG